MNSDRELLELAAKAAGLDLTYCPAWSCMAKKLADLDGEYFDSKTCWNPLTYDGDALRLAVKLNLAVVLHPALNQALVRPYHTRDMDRECREDCEKHTDHFAATRRAIVRAAAEIGRQMQKGGAA